MKESVYPKFTIGFPDSEGVTVELLSPPADKETEGYDWVRARVSVKAGPFSGSTELMTSMGDLTRFRDDLDKAYESLSGGVTLSPLERQIEIELKINDRGQVSVEGYLKEHASYGNQLNFTYSFDQTDLKRTISQLGRAVNELEKQKG